MVTTDMESISKRIVDEFRFYRANQDDMVSKYDGKVIVIKNHKVIGVYDSVTAALTQTRKRHTPGTYLVQQVSEGDKAYTRTFHSPRVALP